MSKLTDKLKSIKKSSWVTIGTFAAAGILIAVAAIGGSQAALTYFSDDWSAQVEMFDIGVSLMEQSDKDTAPHRVAYRNYVTDSDNNWSLSSIDLFDNMLAEDEDLVIGKTYNEALSVQNSGTINEYVRVKVYKYWVDKEGNKVTVLSPNLIDLHYLTGNGWRIGYETDECTVLYYNTVLESGATSAPFTDTITVYIDDSLTADVIKEQEGNVIRYTYKYDKYRFQIECEVDAVQEHNASDAMLSAWGVVPFGNED